jgi:WD40 repeat protein
LVVALKNGQVAIWNHHRSSLIKKIENVSPIKTLMQFQKKYICFSTEDGKIRIVNMDEGKEVRVFRYSETPTALDINEDESLLVVGTNTGNVMKWNLDCVKPPTKKIEFDRKTIDQ